MTEKITTASWINVIPLNRRERFAKWWQEDIRQVGTYISRRNSEKESMTHIPDDEITSIACDGLRDALNRQVMEREKGSSNSVVFPRATPDGSEYFGSISIPVRRTR